VEEVRLMFLGWYDPDKKKTADKKLMDACARYEEKFGRVPLFCLTSPDDAKALGATFSLGLGREVGVQARSYIAKDTFYIGEDAGE
jgi:hypothetical protein